MRLFKRAVTVLALAGFFFVSAAAQEKLTTPLIPREVLFGNPERADPQISPDGTQLGYLAPVDGVLNVWIRTLGKADDRAVTADKHRGIRNFLWQYDNQHILYTQDLGGDENWRLYQTDIASKQTKDLTPFDKVRVDIVAYEWKFPGTILVQMNQRDPKLFDVHRIDLSSGKVELDTENPGDIQSWQADNALQIRGAQAQTPDGGTIVRVRDDSKSPWRELLFSNRPKLEKYKLSAMKPIEFTARDGMKLYGYLTTPAGVEPKSLPMVEFVHGGPWGRDEWGYNRYAQWLSNRGYAVLQINFRGSTGYGKQYVNAGDRQWAGTMHTDLLDGKDWVVKQGIADTAKVCIMGGSYGGYATLAGVTFSPDAFACGVDIVGPSNLNTLLRTIPPYWSTLLATFHKRMGDSEQILKQQSPLFKADQIKAPLLIGQGANDPRVNKAESDQIVAAMRKNSKPVQYYVFPDEGHGFARPANNMAFNAATEEFLAKYLGGRLEPPTADESTLLTSIKQSQFGSQSFQVLDNLQAFFFGQGAADDAVVYCDDRNPSTPTEPGRPGSTPPRSVPVGPIWAVSLCELASRHSMRVSLIILNESSGV